MATLKDQMLKAGLISKQQAKQTAHQQRVESKHVPREERERQAQAQRDAVLAEREAQREADRQLAAQRRTAELEQEHVLQAQARRQSQIEAALRDGRIEHWEGPRTYFFAVGKALDSIGVSEDAARRLAEGTAAIVSTGDPRAPYTLLHAEAARRLLEAAPERTAIQHSRPQT